MGREGSIDNRIFSQLRSKMGDGIIEYDAIISSLMASVVSYGVHFPLLERTGKCISLYTDTEDGFYKGMYALRSILGQDGVADYPDMTFSVPLGGREVRLKGLLARDQVIREVLGKAYIKYSGLPGQENTVMVKSSDIQALPVNLSALEVFVRFFETFVKGEPSVESFGDWAFHMREKGIRVDRNALEEDLSKAGLSSAWRIFAAAAVGAGLCPAEDMPLYDGSYLSRAGRAAQCLVSGNGARCFALKNFPGIALRSGKSSYNGIKVGQGLCPKRRARRLAQARFQELLRAGLWRKDADNSLFRGEVDWNAIYELAYQQAVVGPVSEGIDTLAPGYGPLEKERPQFSREVLSTEKRNRKMDEFIPKVMKFLTGNGIRPVLVKGQGLSCDWPVPSHRSPGDIDLLLHGEDYASARDLLAQHATSVGEEAESILHQDYEFGNITLEIHGSLSTMLNSRVDSVLSDMQDAIFSDGGTVTVPIGGYDCPVPSYDYNAAYVFIHLCKHYFFEGLGLRQLCDWALYMAGHKDDTDFSKAVGIVKEAGLEGPWKGLGKLLADRVGLDPSMMPLYDAGEATRASMAWRYVLKRGNFGVNDGRRKGEYENKIVRKFHTLMFYLPYFARQIIVFPKETLSFFGHFILKGLKGF